MTRSKRHSLLKHQDDFDFWSRLASKDPQRFESMRARLIEEFLETVPEDKRSRLVGMQWRVDQVRQLARNPIDSLNRVSRMMWDELISLNEKQKDLVSFFNEGEADSCREKYKSKDRDIAEILPFKKE